VSKQPKYQNQFRHARVFRRVAVALDAAETFENPARGFTTTARKTAERRMNEAHQDCPTGKGRDAACEFLAMLS